MNSSFQAVLLGVTLFVLPAWMSSPVEAKTRKECRAEYSANKAAIDASGKTRRDYVAECRGGPGGAAAADKPPSKPVELTKGQFATEAEAKSSCPADTVVSFNQRRMVFHVSGSPKYGKTRRGGYMCEKEAIAAGYRAAKRRGAT